jgi:hypothetical protein
MEKHPVFMNGRAPPNKYSECCNKNILFQKISWQNRKARNQ